MINFIDLNSNVMMFNFLKSKIIKYNVFISKYVVLKKNQQEKRNKENDTLYTQRWVKV
jgi:heme/copper-type cytochrome/quinol oxidase subunit 3